MLRYVELYHTFEANYDRMALAVHYAQQGPVFPAEFYAAVVQC